LEVLTQPFTIIINYLSLIFKKRFFLKFYNLNQVEDSLGKTVFRKIRVDYSSWLKKMQALFYKKSIY